MSLGLPSPILGELKETYEKYQVPLFSLVQKLTRFKKEKQPPNVIGLVEKDVNTLRPLYYDAKDKYDAYKLQYEAKYEEFNKYFDINALLAKTNGSSLSLRKVIDRYIILFRSIGGQLVNAQIIEQYPNEPRIEPAYILIGTDDMGVRVPFEHWADKIDEYEQFASFKRSAASRHLLRRPTGGRRRTKRRKGIRTRRR